VLVGVPFMPPESYPSQEKKWRGCYASDGPAAKVFSAEAV
jgi:hypothetical protein